MEGLRRYDDAATWRDDRPAWTRQDEFSARLVESLEHWGPLLLMAFTGAKGSQVPFPHHLFEHPDRPTDAEKSQGSKSLSVAEFQRQYERKQKPGEEVSKEDGS